MIPRGTTPTLRWRFGKTPISELSEACMTVVQNKEVISEKKLNEAKKGEDYIEWTLSQEETLKVKAEQDVEIQLRFRSKSGYAGASSIYKQTGYRILKDGVI